MNQQFTPHQQRVLNCILQAMSNKEIAQTLGISTLAVKHTIQRMAHKRGIDQKRFHLKVSLAWLHYNA